MNKYCYTSITSFTAYLLLSLMPFSMVSASADTPSLKYRLVTVTDDLKSPWSMAFLPDQSILVTERTGQLRHIKEGLVSKPVKGVPEVFYRGQGGLLDIKLHPDYEQNGWLYLSYAHGKRSANALRLMRAKFKGDQLTEQQVLITITPNKDTPVHYAGRIAFLPDNTLLLTTGDGFDYREEAQKKNSQLGKILRLNDDGSIPQGNPFVSEPDSSPAIWTYGHRNPQGLVYDSERKLVISHEHGPKGGDEINIIEPGKNYGWPVITYGRDYSGAIISPFTQYEGMEQPFVDWTPSIAPSSMAVYYGEMFPELNGDLLVTTLKSRELRRVKMNGNSVSHQESLLTDLKQRLRHIEIDKSGVIYLLTDRGKLLRVEK